MVSLFERIFKWKNTLIVEIGVAMETAAGDAMELLSTVREGTKKDTQNVC